MRHAPVKILFLLCAFSFVAQISCAADMARKSPYAQKVKRPTTGEVYVRVTVKKQKKETCNPTSMSIILNYFGVFVSPRALQKASGGTDAYKYSRYLKEQVSRYGMEMIPFPPKMDKNQLFECVIRAVDCGLPMQWLVDLRRAPSYDVNEYQKAQMAAGVAGHARVMHGYVLDRRTRELRGFIFTDPWGLRRRNITSDDMAGMTLGFFLVVPKGFDPAVVNWIFGAPRRKK